MAILERADADKAQGLPELAKVDHMLAAGWGGSGRVLRHASCSAPAVTMDLCMSVGSKAMFRTRASGPAPVASTADFDDVDVPAFLRAQEDDEPAPPPPPPTPEQVLDMGRQVAMVQRREEISRWVRAINRRVLVESVAEQPFSPTLRWLGACIASRVIDWIRDRVPAAANEAAIVAAFIELLYALNDDLDEEISDYTRQWARSMRSEQGFDFEGLVRAALDDFLFDGASRSLRSAAAGVSA